MKIKLSILLLFSCCLFLLASCKSGKPICPAYADADLATEKTEKPI